MNDFQAAPVFLYNLTLKRPTAVTHALYGSFTAPKRHELVVARGTTLELLHVDESSSNRVSSLHVKEAFGRIRDVTAFRLVGAQRDHVIICSDSGRLAVACVQPSGWELQHLETFGRSGLRRAVAGAVVAADPRGRAVFVSAVERQRLVWVLSRDAEGRLAISSPLEAHRSNCVTFAAIGLDCGFEHPTFAVLEADHDASGDDGGRRVTRYMLDMGLNHMVRKNPTPVSQTAHRLICVPGGGEGAGGCLVCEEGRLVWIEGPSPETPDAAPKMVAAAFPVRQGGHGRLMTVAHATHRQKNRYFFLLQLESGDVFKVTLDSGDNIAAAPRRLVILYFDTLAPCSSLAILRNGFLFAASSAAQHHMYQFLSLGDESSGVWCDADTKSPPTFVARPLVNLTESARLDCLGPMQGFIATDIHTQGSGAPQIYAASGRGPQGCALSILRHGLQVSALAQQQLPGVPEAVWTLRGSGGGQHTHIVLSFANGTLTLGVEPSGSVREVPESECNILTGVPSLLIARVDNDVLQVTGIMLRHIRGQQRVSVWNPPPKQRITHAAYSGRQVAVALSGGEIIYFELDAQSGTLLELERHDSGSQVVALTMAPPPAAGVTRSKWLAYCDTDNRLRILSLAPTGLLQRVAVQQLSASPSSLVMSFLHRSGTGAGSSPPALFVFVGTKSGLLLRTSVDVATGALGDTRSRFLGVRPVRIFSIVVAPENNTGVPTEVDNALLAVGDRPWLVFNRQQQLLTMPLSCPPFQSAASFASLVEPHGWVVLDHDQLRVVTVVPTVDPFTCQSLPLVYTPRKQAVHSASGLVVVAQSQANVEPVVPRADAPSFVPHSAPLLEQITQRRVVGVCPETDFTRDDQYSAAAISFIDPFADSGRGAVAFSGELVGGGSVTCMCTVKFESSKTEILCVGVSRSQRLLPTPKNAGGRIFLFSVVRESGGHAVSVKLEQVTDTKEAPTAMAQYNSMLLCALGTKLRIYDLGKKQLLKKCERKNLGRQLVAITVMGNRFVVADSSDSVFWCFYEVTRNLIRVFCDDVIPRHVSAMCALDYNTIAVGDKFGCVSVLRIPDAVNEALRLDAGGADLWPQQLQGAPWKCDEVARFKVDGSVTALSTTSLLGPTGATDPVLLYSTIHGAIGALLPLTSREDVDFLSKLEANLRLKAPPLLGNSHLRYRSSAAGPPLRSVDGDCCETFGGLTTALQRAVATELRRDTHEVLKKLEDVRKNVL